MDYFAKRWLIAWSALAGGLMTLGIVFLINAEVIHKLTWGIGNLFVGAWLYWHLLEKGDESWLVQYVPTQARVLSAKKKTSETT